MTASARTGCRAEFWLLLALSGALLSVRLFAATRVGFGDSEALYAAYALHPQPAYLDHPGLIGVLARAIGGGTAPTPEHAHWVTSVLATLLPWEMALTCRACGASWRRALAAGIVLLLVPEIAIGLFAMTPDLVLSLAWTGAIGLAAAGVSAPPGSARATSALACAGLLAGVATASKVSGALLLGALAVGYASRAVRGHARTIAPWAGLAAGVVVVVPVIAFEAHTGWPMLRHRLVDTQRLAGLSLRNLGALVGGQLAYLSPPVVMVAALGARGLWRERRDAVGRILFASSVVPAVALAALCLWSPVAEPHWLAPALLALCPALARTPGVLSRRAIAVTAGVAGAMVAAVYAWVLIPVCARVLPAQDARLDLASELYGWPKVATAVREEILDLTTPDSKPGDVSVVGPNWVICAQIEVALSGLHDQGTGSAPVGCDTPIPDDYDDWWPRDRWLAADSIVWVTDTRFGPPPELPAYATLRTRHVRIERAGRVVRTFTIAVLTRRAEG